MSREEQQARIAEDLPVGEQAVIEGVMVRAEDRIVTAVRTPHRGIVVREEIHIPWSRRLRLLAIPVLRGSVSFLDMMVVGLRSLSFSADIAMEEEQEGDSSKPAPISGWKQTAMLVVTMAVSLGLGVGIFFFLPLFAAQISGASRDALHFNLIAGLVRMSLFLAYLWAIGQWREIRRVFEYHGAEHMSIFTLEAGVDLTVAQARQQGRLHPRCGTSFLLIVVLLSIFVFALVDTAFVGVFGHTQSLVERFLTHLSVLPLISGISFELLKLSGRMRHHPVIRFLITPGLWLQRITTREPADDQLEVALVAVRHALGKPSLVDYSIWSRAKTADATSGPHTVLVAAGTMPPR